jgi:hypothetical protein
MKRILAGLCVLVIATSAHAATKSWVAGRVGDFNIGTNWSGPTVPVANDIIVINDGTAVLTSMTNPVSGSYGIVRISNSASNLTGRLNIVNGSKLVTTGMVYLGQNSTNSTSILNLTNSTLSVEGASGMYLGYTGTNLTSIVNAKNSTLDLMGTPAAGYSLYVGGNAVLGPNSSATLTMDGSTANTKGVQFAAGAGSAEVNLIGGSALNAVGNVYAGYNAGHGAATVNITDSHLGSSGILSLGASAGALVTMNVTDGTVAANALRIGSDANGVLNMNGGSLSVTGGISIASAAAGMTGAMSVSNGAAISIGNLLMGSTNGATTTSLTLSGSDVLFNLANLNATNSGATLTFNVLDAGGVSTVTASGNVAINQSVLNINLNGNSLESLGNLVLFSGNVIGTFSSVTIDGLDGSGKVVYGADYIALIPEPATVGLFVISSAGLILARRMRNY